MIALLNFAEERHRVLGHGTASERVRSVLAGLTGNDASYAETLDGGTRGYLVRLGWRICAPLHCLDPRSAVSILAGQAGAVARRWPGLETWIQVSDARGNLSPAMMAFVPEGSPLGSDLRAIADAMATRDTSQQTVAA